MRRNVIRPGRRTLAESALELEATLGMEMVSFTRYRTGHPPVHSVQEVTRSQLRRWVDGNAPCSPGVLAGEVVEGPGGRMAVLTLAKANGGFRTVVVSFEPRKCWMIYDGVGASQAKAMRRHGSTVELVRTHLHGERLSTFGD